MKIIAPDYYKDFKCTASACRHTCCEGWEVEIDRDSLEKFRELPDIASYIETDEVPHFRLSENERCPFLRPDGLCGMIIEYGEDILCQTCRDHPRFRNYWTDRVELGLGLVCEEAARIILSRDTPMSLVVLSDDGKAEELSAEEDWLMALRDRLIASVPDTGASARLLEYLLYRHLPDALYDDKLEERLAFIERSHNELIIKWKKTDGSLSALAELCRQWSYDVEYDAEALSERI